MAKKGKNQIVLEMLFYYISKVTRLVFFFKEQRSFRMLDQIGDCLVPPHRWTYTASVDTKNIRVLFYRFEPQLIVYIRVYLLPRPLPICLFDYGYQKIINFVFDKNLSKQKLQVWTVYKIFLWKCCTSIYCPPMTKGTNWHYWLLEIMAKNWEELPLTCTWFSILRWSNLKVNIIIVECFWVY